VIEKISGRKCSWAGSRRKREKKQNQGVKLPRGVDYDQMKEKKKKNWKDWGRRRPYKQRKKKSPFKPVKKTQTWSDINAQSEGE